MVKAQNLVYEYIRRDEEGNVLAINKALKGIDIHINLGLHARVHVSRLATQDAQGFKQWLQVNPTTVIYQLAEPVYEEIEYDGNKLIAESFKDGTLFYNSNIPVSSNINYTFTVPVIDEVNALSTTTDEQDTTIASLAYIQNMQAINSK